MFVLYMYCIMTRLCCYCTSDEMYKTFLDICIASVFLLLSFSKLMLVTFRLTQCCFGNYTAMYDS